MPTDKTEKTAPKAEADPGPPPDPPQKPGFYKDVVAELTDLISRLAGAYGTPEDRGDIRAALVNAQRVAERLSDIDAHIPR